jgi:hypothetical protein
VPAEVFWEDGASGGGDIGADLRRLGRFLVRMQRDDGSFASKYYRHGSKAARNDWISLYYPGEACLALALLYKHDPLPLWLETASKGLMYLAKSRWRKAIVEPDHWALVATEELFSFLRHCGGHANSEWLLDHARRICASMVAARPLEVGDAWEGCLTDDGRTCPTATRLEGLLGGRRLLQEHDPELCHQMDDVIEAGIRFLLRSQIREGPLAGAIPKFIIVPEADQCHLGLGANEVRIDYVQHSLCAMQRYADQRNAVRIHHT